MVFLANNLADNLYGKSISDSLENLGDIFIENFVTVTR